MEPREGPPPRPNTMMVPISYHPNPSMIAPNSAQIMHPSFNFTFNDPVDRIVYDGSSQSHDLSPAAAGFGAGNGRKKRGRPRKYVPDGPIALGLAPAPVSAYPAPDHADSSNAGGAPSSETPVKRTRGRPPGSGKKQIDALGGMGGIGFTPHVITVEAGEDIREKIIAFSMQGPRAVCILSANGAICNVTVRLPTTMPTTMHGSTLTYEGQFEIISLSGSFLLLNGSEDKTSGSLSVSMAGLDGRVMGGVVCGVLQAASSVQVVVASFIEDGKKTNSSVSKSAAPPAPQPQLLSFGGATAAATSSPSQGGSSNSSGENGSSPINNQGSGLYGNNGNQQPINNLHMYQLWASQSQQ